MVIGSHHFRTDTEQDQLSMTSLANRIAIIGAGQAGSSVDAVKRSSGSGGAVWLLGAEPAPNLQRPLLSNAFLKDEIGADFVAGNTSIAWRGGD